MGVCVEVNLECGIGLNGVCANMRWILRVGAGWCLEVYGLINSYVMCRRREVVGVDVSRVDVEGWRLQISNLDAFCGFWKVEAFTMVNIGL